MFFSRFVHFLLTGVQTSLVSDFKWSCAGFTSRVKFFSVLDPKRMCYYISEVLDAGLLGPLFKVGFIFVIYFRFHNFRKFAYAGKYIS